jgi:hypothetical protein
LAVRELQLRWIRNHFPLKTDEVFHRKFVQDLGRELLRKVVPIQRNGAGLPLWFVVFGHAGILFVATDAFELVRVAFE